MQLVGLLITKDDEAILPEWCQDQLRLYDAVVCLDGSTTSATEQILHSYGDRVLYLHERDYHIPHKTDHGLRRVVHEEIVRRFGTDHWVMCCHADEFCYHDPRQVAQLAEQQGADLVSWFSLHFYPHPNDLPDWQTRQSLSIPQRFRHYHWGFGDSGLPWIEDRLYRNGPGVAWDHVTHSQIRPHGLRQYATFHPALRHYKVLNLNPEWYDNGLHCGHYHTHWQGLPDRTGVPFPVTRFEDLFVRTIPGYRFCDRFEDSLPHLWNIGDQYRVETLSIEQPETPT